MRIIQLRNVSLLSDSGQKRKGSVEYTAIVGANDQPIFCAVPGDCLQTITITSRCARRAQFGKKRANVFPAAKNECVFGGNARYWAGFGISLPKRSRQFRRRGTQNHTIANDGDKLGKRGSLGFEGVIAKPAISATFAVEWRTQKRQSKQSDDRL